MDKLKLAHDYLRDIIKASGGYIDVVEMPEAAWKLVDAMQAEADKRINKERPDVLCEVDWGQAPEDAVAFLKLSEWGIPVWINKYGIQIEDAPSFGFTGSHIVERPHGF